MYHEILAEARGEPPASTDIYKLGEREFRRHLEAIAAAAGGKMAGRVDVEESWRGPRPVFLTFDDGEESAYTIAAGLLEERGWRGHFFVTTDYIGRSGFLSRGQIRELAERGHVIGSHTCSHPVPMSRCSWAQLQREWGESTRILAEITGSPVCTGSVPGGFYSPQVAKAAVEAGLRVLFTSEPVASGWWAGDCLVLGRYAIRRGMGAETAAALAGGRVGPRWRQAAAWNARKVLKRANFGTYQRLRSALLGL